MTLNTFSVCKDLFANKKNCGMILAQYGTNSPTFTAEHLFYSNVGLPLSKTMVNWGTITRIIINATAISQPINLPCVSLTDVQHHCDLPRWESSPAGAGLHPWEQDPLSHPTRHVKECTHVKEHEEQEPGIRGRERQGGHSQSSRCVPATEMDVS